MKNITVLFTFIACIAITPPCEAQNTNLDKAIIDRNQAIVDSIIKTKDYTKPVFVGKEIWVKFNNPDNIGYRLNPPVYDSSLLYFDGRTYLRPTDSTDVNAFIFITKNTGTAKIVVTATRLSDKNDTLNLANAIVFIKNH